MEFLIFKTAGINRVFLWVLSAADLNIPGSRRGHGHAWPRNGRQLRFSVKLFLEVHSTSDKEETPVFPPVLSWPWVTAPVASHLSMSELCVHLLQLREVRVFPCYSVIPPEISVHVPSGAAAAKPPCSQGHRAAAWPAGGVSGRAPAPALLQAARRAWGAQACGSRACGPSRCSEVLATSHEGPSLCTQSAVQSLQVPCWVSATASCTVSLE